MTLGTILLILLILILVGVLPTWPHSSRWVVLLIVIVLLLMGRI
jgi:hypothetical protein